MKYLPYEGFCITTPLNPAQAEECLKREVEPVTGFNLKGFFYRKSAYYFSGDVGYGKFELEPIINYRNSYLPQIIGEVKPYLNGSQIKVKMRLNYGVFVFMCIWFGFGGFMAIFVLYRIFTSSEFSIIALGPVIMMALGYAMTMEGFKNESCSAKKKLLQIWDGEITEEQ